MKRERERSGRKKTLHKVICSLYMKSTLISIPSRFVPPGQMVSYREPFDGS
jgi:hypothetical protein